MTNFLAKLSLVALFFVTGCASITTGQTQPISIDAPACPAASCKLTNKEGVFYVPSTPGTVTIDRACGKLSIQCSKPGEKDFVMTVGSSVKPMAFGNILFGGFIGAGVDAMTGAACEYPDLIPVPMTCSGTQNTSAAAASHVTPKAVIDMALQMKCRDLNFIAKGDAGVDVYTATCEENSVILSCTDVGCLANEVEMEN